MNTPSALEISLKALQLWSEMHPRPSQVTQDQAAEMLNMSHCTVRKLIRSGEIKLNRCGKIPICEIDKVLAPMELQLAPPEQR